MSVHPKTVFDLRKKDPEFPGGFLFGRKRYWTESELAAYMRTQQRRGRDDSNAEVDAHVAKPHVSLPRPHRPTTDFGTPAVPRGTNGGTSGSD